MSTEEIRVKESVISLEEIVPKQHNNRKNSGDRYYGYHDTKKKNGSGVNRFQSSKPYNKNKMRLVMLSIITVCTIS